MMYDCGNKIVKMNLAPNVVVARIMFSRAQLKAASSALGLPVSAPNSELARNMISHLRKGGLTTKETSKKETSKTTTKKAAPKKEISKTATKKATKKETSKTATKKTKKEASTKKKAAVAAGLPRAFNGEVYGSAVKRLVDQGFREVVAALSGKGAGGSDKVWILMRKRGTKRPADRVTLWGAAKGGPRHTYGGTQVYETDAEFVESKLKKGYRKNPALLRLVRKVVK